MKWHHHRCFSVNIFMRKYFFIALFHASVRSQMFYKIDPLKNPRKFTGKRQYQVLLTPAQMFFWEVFEIFRNAFFIEHLRTTASYFNSIFLLFKDIYVSEQINICLIFRAILGYIKIHGPLGLHTFFTQSNYYWCKNYTCIKKLHGIYFIKYINYFRQTL